MSASTLSVVWAARAAGADLPTDPVGGRPYGEGVSAVTAVLAELCCTLPGVQAVTVTDAGTVVVKLSSDDTAFYVTVAR